MVIERLNQSYWQLIFQISVVETENECIDVMPPGGYFTRQACLIIQVKLIDLPN